MEGGHELAVADTEVFVAVFVECLKELLDSGLWPVSHENNTGEYARSMLRIGIEAGVPVFERRAVELFLPGTQGGAGTVGVAFHGGLGGSGWY